MGIWAVAGHGDNNNNLHCPHKPELLLHHCCLNRIDNWPYIVMKIYVAGHIGSRSQSFSQQHEDQVMEMIVCKEGVGHTWQCGSQGSTCATRGKNDWKRLSHTFTWSIITSTCKRKAAWVYDVNFSIPTLLWVVDW